MVPLQTSAVKAGNKLSNYQPLWIRVCVEAKTCSVAWLGCEDGCAFSP